MSRILLAMLIDVAILAYPAYLALQYRKLPAIHDITTDPIDPPRFDALARLRASDGANTAVYAGLYSAELQRAAWPDIEPVDLDVPVQRAYEVTLAAGQQAQMAGDRRTRAAAAAPHRPHRGGGAHADHGVSRGRLDPHHARRRGIARRYPLLVALFRKRPRQQRLARHKADRGHQHRRGQDSGAEEAGRAGEGPPAKGVAKK